ncbi:MAG: HAD-IA family hydrolase [Oscillospiraceae bacterium]|nr:HAD-IA family hydrolase [Oscillospiraceae bacterium]
MNYKAVCFDFDYTLGDATVAIVAAYEYALAELGHPKPEREAVRRTVGYSVQDGYTMLTGDADPERRDRALELFRAIAKPMQLTTTKLFDGAAELLAGLHGNGVKIAVVSSKGGDTLKKVMDYCGILRYIDFVVGAWDVTNQKPDPEGLLWAVEQFGLAREQVLYCGDSLVDAETARRAGVDFCAVLNGTTTEEEFAPFPRVHVAPDLNQLALWLDTI